MPTHAPPQQSAPLAQDAPWALQHLASLPHVRPGQSLGPVHPHDEATHDGPSVEAAQLVQMATNPEGA
jgi:hypothetical protein